MRCCVCGAGGFIGGHLVGRLLADGHFVTAVDRKPLPEWYQHHNMAVELCADLHHPDACDSVCAGMEEVYQLAASMGGMGWIERERIDCMRNVSINTHMLEAAYRAGVKRFLFSSSACVYAAGKQTEVDLPPLREADAYPAEAERGYGWEKLYAEMLCREYWEERGMETYIPRFFNIAGPSGTWCGGREKAPAALCRKVIEAKDQGLDYIEIWGDGQQVRDFTWIGDCIEGIRRIMGNKDLIATPINLGSEEAVTINQLADMACDIGGVTLEKRHNLDAPKGVRGRNSDNTFIRSVLKWEPKTPLRYTMERVYQFVEQQYMLRKAGRRVVE